MQAQIGLNRMFYQLFDSLDIPARNLRSHDIFNLVEQLLFRLLIFVLFSIVSIFILVLELSGSNCQRFHFYKISTSYDHLCFYVSKNIFSSLPLTIILTADHKSYLPRFQPITTLCSHVHIPCKEMNSKCYSNLSETLIHLNNVL